MINQSRLQLQPTDQRQSVLCALCFTVFTLLCGVFGIAADSYFYETWARSLSGKNVDANWKHRERANLVRKFFTFAAMATFFLGTILVARYIYQEFHVNDRTITNIFKSEVTKFCYFR